MPPQRIFFLASAMVMMNAANKCFCLSHWFGAPPASLLKSIRPLSRAQGRMATPSSGTFQLKCNVKCRAGFCNYVPNGNSPSPRLPFLISTRLSKNNLNDFGTGRNFEPTWTYTPYQPPPSPRKKSPGNIRKFSSHSEWTVPDVINIPEDKIRISFARSSGAGGQNVNKVNTKVEIRFQLDSASWIPSEVRERLKQNEANRINNEGFMTVTSQEYRTQAQNRKDAIEKLRSILKKSWGRPKVRKMRKGISQKTKQKRREMKKKISEKKVNRRRVDF